MTKTHQEFIDEVSEELRQVYELAKHFTEQRNGLIKILTNFQHNYVDFASSDDDNRKLFRLHEDFLAYLLLCLNKRESGLKQQLKILKQEKERQDKIDDIKPPSSNVNI